MEPRVSLLQLDSGRSPPSAPDTPLPAPFFTYLALRRGCLVGSQGQAWQPLFLPNPHTTSLTGVMHSKFLPKKPELSTHKPARIAPARGSGTNPRTVGTAHSPEPTGTGS